MAKWILWLFLFFGILSCQSETITSSTKESLPSASGTAAPPSRAAVPLVFFLKEAEIFNNGDKISVRNRSLFQSLPPGVYALEADTIVFGKAPRGWISSGITRWPKGGRVALTDFIMTDNPLSTPEIAIFPQKPSIDGYLPGCFSCPTWMAKQYGVLLIFWEKYMNIEY